MQRGGLMVSDRKGLSDVVTSVLLILLVLVSIVILWAVISSFIKNTTSNLDSSQLTISFDVVSAQSLTLNGNPAGLTVKVRRNAGEGTVSALVINVQDANGNSKVSRYTPPSGFNVGETQTIVIPAFDIQGLGKVTGVSATPIFKLENGKESSAVSTATLSLGDSSLALQDVIAYYSFDEPQWTVGSPTILDKTSNILHATPKGNVKQDTTNAVLGKSVYISGSSGDANYIELPGSVAGQGLDSPFTTGEMTFTAWIKPEDDFSEVILGGSTSYTTGLNIESRTTNTPSMSVFSNAWRNSIPGAIVLNKWNFVAMTLTNAGKYNFYVNGKLVDAVTGQAALGVIPSYTGIRKLGAQVGSGACTAPNVCRTIVSGNSWWEYRGYLDEVVLFKKALSASDIQNMYIYYGPR